MAYIMETKKENLSVESIKNKLTGDMYKSMFNQNVIYISDRYLDALIKQSTGSIRRENSTNFKRLKLTLPKKDTEYKYTLCLKLNLKNNERFYCIEKLSSNDPNDDFAINMVNAVPLRKNDRTLLSVSGEKIYAVYGRDWNDAMVTKKTSR